MTPNSKYPDLVDAPVLITGGANGIGAALTIGFAQQGCKTAIIDIDAEAISNIKKQCEHLRHPPVCFEADLSDVTAAQAAAEKAASALGGIQVLINNAACDKRHDADTITAQEWRRSLSVNLDPVMFVTQAAMPHLISSGKGSVINFSSIAFMLNMGDLPAYGTAKAAIVGLTKTLAGRYGINNVRANAVLPGMIVTERQKKLWLTESSIEAFVERQCLKRSLVAEDLVGPCLFLASADSAAITAQSIIVDAGAF